MYVYFTQFQIQRGVIGGGDLMMGRNNHQFAASPDLPIYSLEERNVEGRKMRRPKVSFSFGMKSVFVLAFIDVADANSCPTVFPHEDSIPMAQTPAIAYYRTPGNECV